MRHCQLVSPPLPSGQTWLVNALMALRLRLTGHGACWRPGPAGETLEPGDFRTMLEWFLPILHERQAFVFDEELEIYWNHQLAFAQYPARKTILMLRDPRDAFYSHFRREQYPPGTTADLLTMLQQPRIWAAPIILPMHLPPADMYAYFSLCWMHQLPPERLLVVTFEASRRDPQATLQRVLAFLGIVRSDAEIAAAIAASTTARARAANRLMEARTGTRRLLARAGAIGEARQGLPPAALQAFAGPAASLIATLNYPPLDPPPCPPPAADLLEAATPWLEALRSALEAYDPAKAMRLLRAGLDETDGELRRLVAGQLLALYWVRVILRPAQLQLPAAERMSRCLCTLNLRFHHWPPLRQAFEELYDAGHPFHHLSLADNVHESHARDFGTALAACRQEHKSLLWWNPQRVRLTQAGFLQLRDLLDGRRPDMCCVRPRLVTAGSDFLQRAWEQHAAHGAEFIPLQGRPQPPLMIAINRLEGSPPVVPDLAFEALGVLAEA